MNTLLQKLTLPAVVVLAAILVLYGIGGITSVEPGEVTLMVKMLGSDETRGMQEETLGTGTHWVEPFSYDTPTYITQTQQYDTGLTDLPSQTKDGQPILVDLSFGIGLTANLVPKLHEEVGKGWYNEIIYPAVRSAVRNATSTQMSDEIYTGAGRQMVTDSIQAAIAEKGAKYGIMVNVNLRDVEFTNKGFVNVLEKKAIAAQNVEIENRNALAAEKTAIKMANIAEGAKQERIKAAEAKKEEAKLEGEGRKLQKEADAKGILAIGQAEAETVRLKREAYAGKGGAELVSIAWAENLGPNVKVYGIPTGAPGTASMMDLNGILGGAFKGVTAPVGN